MHEPPQTLPDQDSGDTSAPQWATRLADARWLRRAVAVAAIVLALVFIVGRFWNIHLGDFRHWDESLYAWRAKVAVATGEWGDQTDYTFNFFYSSSFPPLLIWEMASGFALFGDVEWAARAPVAMHGVVALLSIAALGWLLGGPSVGWMALVLLGSISYFTRYSRAAQFDVPAVSWMLAMLACYVASLRFPRRRFLWAAIAGVMWGAGLMTKIAVAGFAYPALIATIVLWWTVGRRLTPAAEGDTTEPRGTSICREAARRGVGGLILDQVVLGAIATALWLPWHVWMTFRYGAEFWDWYLGYHLFDRSKQVLDGHNGQGAWWFYLYSAYDRLPTALVGLGLLSWLWMWPLAARSLFSRRAPDQQEHAPALATRAHTNALNWLLVLTLPWLWTTSLWLLFESSATKREIYQLTIHPAIALAAAILTIRMFRQSAANSMWWVVLFVVAFLEILSRDSGREFAVGQYISGAEIPPHGNSVAKELLLVVRDHLIGAAVIGALPAIVGALSSIRAPRPRARWWRDATGRLVLVVLLAISLWRQGVVGMFETDRYDEDRKWADVKPWLHDEERYPMLAFVGDGEGPQFMYYLNGNHPESLPLPQRPIGRFYQIEGHDRVDVTSTLRNYAVPGGALIYSDWYLSSAINHPRWGEMMNGFEEVFRNDDFVVFEFRGAGPADD